MSAVDLSHIKLTPENGYYLAFETVFIIADHPRGPELMKKCPHIPAGNKVALDLITELTHSKITAEAKIMLLKKAIEALMSDPSAFCPTSNPRVFFKDGKLYVMQDLEGHQIFTPYIYGSKPPYPEPSTS